MQIQYSYKYYRATRTPFYSSIDRLYDVLLIYTPLYSSSINRLYAQNPVFEIVYGERVIVYLHMYSGNVQQNPLCVESSCVTKVFSMFPRFSPTIFYRDANSVLLQIIL